MQKLSGENCVAWLPAGVSDQSDVRNGAVEEDGQEGGASRVNRQAPNGVVVVGDPIGHPISLWLGAFVTTI